VVAEWARGLQTRVRPGGCLEVRDDEAALGVPLDQIHRADQSPRLSRHDASHAAVSWDSRSWNGMHQRSPSRPTSASLRTVGRRFVQEDHPDVGQVFDRTPGSPLCCIPSHNPAFRGTLGHS
jgi:hypothetical protein